MSILDQKLNGVKEVAILGHVRPDGDCLGSCLGMWNYLKTAYPQVEAQVFLEEIPAKFGYLNGSGQIRTVFAQEVSYDLCICIDSSDKERLGEGQGIFGLAKDTLCIDHHITNEGFAASNVIDPGASSSCEVLYGLLEDSMITKETAECLYTGIIHDTGVFKHSCTSEQTMIIAGRLLSMGVDSTKVIDGTFYEKSYIENQILGRCLMESMLVLDGRVILSYLNYKTMRLYGVVPANLSGIIDQLRVTKGTEVAIFIYESQPQHLKVSLRSNGNVDVSKTAVFFGGGGHKKAAGYEVHGFMHDAINNLLAGIEHQLDGQ